MDSDKGPVTDNTVKVDALISKAMKDVVGVQFPNGIVACHKSEAAKLAEKAKKDNL